MSTAVATSEPIRITPENFQEVVDKPLRCLPHEVRPAVLGLWTVHRRLFPSALEISASFAVWMNDHGLTAADVTEICRAMTAPGRMAAFKFPADLTTALAEAADAIMRRRKQAEEQRQQRQKYEYADALPLFEVSKLFQEFNAGGKRP